MGSNRIKAHYNRNTESDRFSSPQGRLEYERTKAIISRHLPSSSAEILDVGGGTGAYSFWLAGLGHTVSMVDISEAQIEMAGIRNREEPTK